MAKVHYEYPDGEVRVADVAIGESVMRGAVNGGFPGIVAECGGVLTCATCHVHIAQRWLSRVPPAGSEELEMLEMVDDYDASSRLSCQVFVTQELDGLAVAIPPSNL